MKNLNFKRTGYVVGIIFVFFYIVCTVWGTLISSLTLKELHLMLLQLTYPGFGFNVVGYTIGLIESFAYGWVLGALFVWLCKKVCITNEEK